jgi:hypothetical protein
MTKGGLLGSTVKVGNLISLILVVLVGLIVGSLIWLDRLTSTQIDSLFDLMKFVLGGVIGFIARGRKNDTNP